MRVAAVRRRTQDYGFSPRGTSFPRGVANKVLPNTKVVRTRRTRLPPYTPHPRLQAPYEGRREREKRPPYTSSLRVRELSPPPWWERELVKVYPLLVVQSVEQVPLRQVVQYLP